MSQERGQRTNWAQVRDDIDSGRAGDKIKVSDPAAAPLGTDAEADGSTPPEDDARSRAASRAAQEASHDGRRRHQERDRRQGALLVTIGIAVLAAIVAGLLLVST